MEIHTIALTFFLITNPIGNVPAIAALIKDFPLKKQKQIMIREGIFTLIIALFFQFFGEIFLNLITAKSYTVRMTGGIILILWAFNMIFPQKNSHEEQSLRQEPFFVPIATPLLSGPALLNIIMFYSTQEPETWKISVAIFMSWIGVMMVLMIAPFLQKIVGKRGLYALEQLMGMVLALMGIEMIVNGLKIFISTFS